MRAVIFSNGHIEEPQWIVDLLDEDDFLIAADGGLRYVLDLNRVPDVLIGDLDSVSDENLRDMTQKQVEIIRFPPEKDQTDLELAIEEVYARGCRDIIIIGALGGRFDQTLANLSLLTDSSHSGLRISLDDGSEKVSLVEGRIEILGAKGDTVSLIPYCGPVEGITTRGLAFPLKGETLYPGKTRGISNEMLSARAEVTIKKGRLLCIQTRKNKGRKND